MFSEQKIAHIKKLRISVCGTLVTGGAANVTTQLLTIGLKRFNVTFIKFAHLSTLITFTWI